MIGIQNINLKGFRDNPNIAVLPPRTATSPLLDGLKGLTPMTTSTATYSAVRPQSKALLPWLFAMAAQQWKAWQAARRAVRSDELTWNMALQDARIMADLSRAMSAAAAKR